MGEFVEGFERLSKIGPCVSIFGSARTDPENKYYAIAEELAYQLSQNKFGVITGGGLELWKLEIKELKEEVENQLD